MNARILALLVAVSAVGASTPASAQYYFGFCSEPSKPYCINSSFAFDDEFSFSSCRREVESNSSGMGDYMDCLARELDGKLDEIRRLRSEVDDIQSAHSEASGKANEVIEEFNCRARSGTFC